MHARAWIVARYIPREVETRPMRKIYRRDASFKCHGVFLEEMILQRSVVYWHA